MNERAHIDALNTMAQPHAVAHAQADALFDDAMAQADAWHRSRNPAYARLWQGASRPLIPVGLFKQVNLSTPVGDEADGLWLTSSGTSGQGATSVHFDAISMGHIQTAMVQMFLHAGMFSARPARFLHLSPDPRLAAAGTELAGYAQSFHRFTACAPAQIETVFAVDTQGRFDAAAAWATLRAWAEHDDPVFVFGLTVWFERLALAAPAEPLAMRGEVKGITGGGWKGMVQQLERPEILARLGAAVQAPGGVDIRDIYGMTEHPLHYLSCRAQRFHLPLYSRALIMGADGQAVAMGETGLIRLLNPFFASLPSHDLLTQDMGVMGQGCACGSEVPWLRFVGRAGGQEGLCAAEALHASAGGSLRAA
ncbi:MAG: hypothetical protein RI907_502 [Pseudomonadota bacterium]|jgi:hypothetical protein